MTDKEEPVIEGHDATLCVQPPNISLEGFASLSTPIYRASTIVFPDATAYRNRKSRGAKGYSYGLGGTPTSRTLEAQISALEGGCDTVLAPSGLSAIALVAQAFLRPGDRVAVVESAYPPVLRFCRDYLEPMGVGHDLFSPDLSDIGQALKEGTKLVWAESPGSTTMEIQDLRRLSQIAHERGSLIGCDNTWATPLLYKPLAAGVDFSMQALTKYAGGHSDVLMGSISVSQPKLFQRLAEMRTILGIGVSPDDCALVLRGAETSALRLAHSGRVALDIARRCSKHFSVARVLHPALPGCPGHDIWAKEFRGASGVFSLELTSEAAEHVDAALSAVKIFAIGASWGGTHSLIVPMTAERRGGSSPTYLRLSIGLEDATELAGEVEAILDRLDRAAREGGSSRR